MNGFLTTRIKEIDLKTVLELLMLLSLLVVWVVWPLRGTIAARNIALVSGAIASIAWLRIERPKFAMMDLLPIGFLLCIPVWLLCLYIFNPTVPHLQWNDLRGTWMRVVIAIIFAIGLGKLYLCRQQYQPFFFWLLCIWPVVTFLIFISQGIFTHSWFGEQIYIYVFKSKVAGVYFLMWSLLLCFAMAHWYFIKVNSLKKKSYNTFSYYKYVVTILFSICIVDFISLQSLNGFIAIFVCLVLMAWLLMSVKTKHYNWGGHFFRVGLIWIGIFCFLFTVLHYDAKYSNRKLTNLVDDINFIVNKDNSGAWKWDGSYSGEYPMSNPINGNKVNMSTYERLTWTIEGFRFLKEHPLGLGFTGQSFGYYMASNYPGSKAKNTHSGWLDFALGTGFIGLTSLWLAMGMICYRAWISMGTSITPSLTPYYICWSLVIFMLLWFTAEFSDREFIEHFFLMVAFFSVISSFHRPSIANA
jgi:hypothetical protein